MSIFKEIWSDLKKKPEHDGIPYSIDEILSMDDEELGAKYKSNLSPVSKYSKKTVIFLTVLRKALKFTGVALIFISLAVVIKKWPVLFSFVTSFMMFVVAPTVMFSIFDNEDLFQLDNYDEKTHLFDNVMIDDWSAFVAESTSNHDKMSNDRPDKFVDFLNDMEGIRKIGFEYGYPDEEEGEWLKIITPLAALHHEDVVINGRVFYKLNECLDLSGRAAELLRQMEEHKKIVDAQTEEKAYVDAKMAADRSDRKVDAMISVIDRYKKRRSILDGSGGYKRIIDLKNRIECNSDTLSEKIKGCSE